MNRKDWLKTAGLVGAGMFARPLQALPHILDPSLRRADFGPGFQWGVATAAYQVEGAWNVDGKGPSIWDTFSHTRGKIKDGSNGDTACDQYHRYPEDLALLRELHIPNYRFSTAWSRILPEGVVGKPNLKGLDHYDRVVDECMKLGIRPWVTLYHWDLPQALQDKGGWLNRDIIGWFTDYVDLVTLRLGDRVKDWMVLNEPMAFVGLGHMLGIHAPGLKGPFKFLQAAHHACMCQAEGARLIRLNVKDAQIGTTFSCSHIMPISDKEKHHKSTRRVDALWNRLFLEPALGLGYPVADFPMLRYMNKYIKEGDREKLAFDFDFIGLQNYTREVVKRAMIPFVRSKFVAPAKRGVPAEDITEMGWEVYPEGIYHLLKKFNAYPQIKKIIVTENGAAFPDTVANGRVADPRRQKFIEDYLAQVLRAKQEGVHVDGYFIWTMMDNFEWAEGYHPRFGLIHVDFETQKRTVKDSGYWFRDFLKGE